MLISSETGKAPQITSASAPNAANATPFLDFLELHYSRFFLRTLQMKHADRASVRSPISGGSSSLMTGELSGRSSAAAREQKSMVAASRLCSTAGVSEHATLLCQWIAPRSLRRRSPSRLNLGAMPLPHTNTAVTTIRARVPKNCRRRPLNLHVAENGLPLRREEYQVPDPTYPRIYPLPG